MDWSTLTAALVGGLIGAGIPAAMTGLGWRREAKQRREAQLWEDAPVVADVRQFLQDIDPGRRGASADRRPGVEDERWAGLQQRCHDLQRRLLGLAVAHPSKAVRSPADKLAVDVLNAAFQSQWHVNDILRDRDNAEQHRAAQKSHQIALVTAAELERAVKGAMV